ncbi:MAG: EAL domain-containing protein [Succinivibrionaceae bacterium]|nr:EAL domain-containing protein [Succinivibrionaceae bacterium]
MSEIQRNEQNVRRRVLLVEDEAINQKILSLIIQRKYDVICAGNGRQALDILAENHNTISLILLDLKMPEMDGFQVLEEIQKSHDLRRIPVIVMTSDEASEIRCIEEGAADFMPKPYDDPKLILARCNRAIVRAEDRILINESEHDQLTGLYNRLFFLQYAKQHDRYSRNDSMDAVVINVNRFRLINSLYGRSYGDRILKTVGGLIREYLDQQKNGIACRCESDTFYIYMPHSSSHEKFAGDLIEKFDRTIENSRISLRIGIYEYADQSIAVEQRFDMAKTACNKLRATYTSGYNLYDSMLHEKELYNEKLIMEMDRALAEKQFKVFYQPKYRITGDKPELVSAEALIRWIHPEFGIISPGIFISLFEANGLLQKLDQYVWNETAVQIRKWKDGFGRTIPVSVNVSRTDIYDLDLEKKLKSIVDSNGLATGELLLEITESAYTDNTRQIIETVNNLREMGFKVEMDDFGSGYSSLNMLSSLPIDALKLDMQFIRNITRSPKDYNLLLIMLQIAKFLNVPTVAEGVETREQYEMLKKAGCDIIQGYYFSKPVPPEDFEKLFDKEWDQ